jgi:hypothetical protein
MHSKFVLNNIGQEFSFIKKLHICLPIFAIVNLCEGKKNLNHILNNLKAKIGCSWDAWK